MKRSIGFFVLFFFVLTITGHSQRNDVKKWASSLKGQEFFLKIDVVKVQYLFRGTDATNVFPGGLISYRATIGSRQTQSESAEDFAEEARIRSAAEDDPPQVRVLNRGSLVRIREVKARDDEVKVEFEEIGGSKHALRLKFDYKNYSLDEAQLLFDVAFTANESDLLGAEESILIREGMAPAEVIEVLGQPDIRAEFAEKTVFIYSSMKLIFSSGKLVDVQ